MSTRIIGIDLAVTAAHKAAILDPATNRFVVKQMTFRTSPAELDKLLRRARHGAGDNPEIIVVLEATSLAWHPVSLYLQQHGAKLYRVNGRMTKRMRHVRYPHARSDRLDCQVLATLYNAYPSKLDPLYIPTGEEMTLQRACREFVRYREAITAIDNRLTAYDNWAWHGLTRLIPARALDWMRTEWYNPWDVTAAGIATLRSAWLQQPASKNDDCAWFKPWLQRAEALTQLLPSPEAIDYPALVSSTKRALAQRACLSEEQDDLFKTVIAPLYRRLFPDCQLTSLYGVGEQSVVIYMAFIHSIDRFPTVDSFRQWTGMVPASDQSGNTQSKGLGITQAGPNIVKATLFLDAHVARRYDPQLAAIYYKQMVLYGKHYTQAICVVASHLANRIYALLKENRAYELRDLDGEPISSSDARALIEERFLVPAEVRRRTSKNVRRNPQPAPAL